MSGGYDFVDTQMKAFFGKIRKKWQLIAYISLILGAVAFFVSTLVSPKYRSDVTLLVVQRNIDTLSASRSAEYLNEVFSQVLYTESFLNDVLASPLGIDKKFSPDPRKKKKQWGKKVGVKKVGNSGILQISVFDTSRLQAEKIAGGIGWNFANNGGKYHGGAENIEVKIIDGPITSSKPVHPNVFVNSLFGFLAGLFGSLVLVYFFDGFDIRVFDYRRAAPSIVEREIQRQLKKRSQQAGFKLGPDEQDVYEIRKSVKTTDKQSGARQVGDEKNSEGIIRKSATTREEANLRQWQLREKTEAIEDPKEIFKKEPNFLAKLYQGSLFSDKLFSRNKKEVSRKERELQQQKDHARDETVEHVKKLNNVVSDSDRLPQIDSGRTAPAPDNLPIFLQEDGSVVADRAEDKELGDVVVSKSDEAKEQREPTDDEVKERLNKLLKGEL